MKKESKYKFTSTKALKKLRECLTDVEYENGKETFTYVTPKTMFREVVSAGGVFAGEVEE